MMKKSVLPFALVCSALMLNPYVGGQAHAEVQNVQQAKAVKGTVVDETGEPVIGADCTGRRRKCITRYDYRYGW